MSDLYIGIMTGNSMDAADAVLASFAGQTTRIVASASVPIAESLAAPMRRLASERHIHTDELLLTQNRLTDVCAQAVRQLEAGPARVTAIGCHGQTVAHLPAAQATWQLLNPARLAEQSGCSVVADFRARDLASGGQGAPLAPFFHRYFFAAYVPCQIINIGAFANITALAADGGIAAAYDTGPGMVLLDAYYQRQCGGRYDEDGAYARRGTVDEPLLKELLAHPYFALPPPKSCGREEFSLALLPAAAESLPPPDVQATLLELTARTIAAAVSERRVFLCGGGSSNPLLRERLTALLPAPPQCSDEVGLPRQLMEATAFAYLAKCHVEGLALPAAAVTGGQPRIAGAYYPR